MYKPYENACTNINDYNNREKTIPHIGVLGFYGYQLSRSSIVPSNNREIIYCNAGSYGFKDKESAIQDAKKRLMDKYWQLGTGIVSFYIELYHYTKTENGLPVINERNISVIKALFNIEDLSSQTPVDVENE